MSSQNDVCSVSAQQIGQAPLFGAWRGMKLFAEMQTDNDEIHLPAKGFQVSKHLRTVDPVDQPGRRGGDRDEVGAVRVGENPDSDAFYLSNQKGAGFLFSTIGAGMGKSVLVQYIKRSFQAPGASVHAVIIGG